MGDRLARRDETHAVEEVEAAELLPTLDADALTSLRARTGTMTARLDECPFLRSMCGMQLTGFHHLTAVTADAPRNHEFYTRTLGLRLVKKTVNQDDVSAYHLFYADGLAAPGTDITFFDWPVPRERRGTNSIVRTGLRVGS